MRLEARLSVFSISAMLVLGRTVSAAAPPCQWSPLGNGVNGDVYALAAFDDGSGPELFVGGSFTMAGGSPANNIAKWDGVQWVPLGSGLNGTVRAITVFDDGSGQALFVGGSFTTAGGSPANNIAKWDGVQWVPLGSGLNDAVRALTVFDDGSGPELFVGGSFTTADGVPAIAMAKWDGGRWASLDGGLGRLCARGVTALAVFDDGTGSALYAAGGFHEAGGVEVRNIAKWDGLQWSSVGGGLGGRFCTEELDALAVFDDGTGSAPYTSGTFNALFRWDGTQWNTVATFRFFSIVLALTVFDDGAGLALYVGGGFRDVDGVTVNNIAKWDGVQWSALGSGFSVNDTPRALTGFDDGVGGPALYAGGRFGRAGGVPAENVAKWSCQ